MGMDRMHTPPLGMRIRFYFLRKRAAKDIEYAVKTFYRLQKEQFALQKEIKKGQAENASRNYMLSLTRKDNAYEVFLQELATKAGLDHYQTEMGRIANTTLDDCSEELGKIRDMELIKKGQTPPED